MTRDEGGARGGMGRRAPRPYFTRHGGGVDEARLQRAMRGRATEEEKGLLRAEADALSPLVDEARRELAVADERDEDAERDAWQIARGGD